ncbi:hypothetical protein QVD17_07875 [Tagetes erecta]|uniref:Uncharacterized protein n=1 Tax=Tagetes erecta TaxID=13708 RepID=A0AAD8P492_TARER|nr:hypothetical protein QVD17_07875 [Tagetes erecta]
MTGEIIGRGIERQGLYYVEEVTQHGTVMLAHGITNREAWLWHRRLGHPSIGCLGARRSYWGAKLSFFVLFLDDCTPLATATYLINRLPTKALDLKTPLQTLSEFTKIPPALTLKPRVFGCSVFVHIPKVSDFQTHVDIQNTESHENQNDNTPDDLEIAIEETVQEEQHELIHEEQHEPIHEEQSEPEQIETTERYILPPRANRGIPPKRYSPEKQTRSSRYPMASIAKANLSNEAKAFNTSLYSEQIPTTVKEALESKNWKDAMETEMEALKKSNTWEKCTLPPGKKPVGCRWLFSVKHKPDVSKFDTIRVLFSVAANKGWPLHQFDVKNAFLHGDLKEEVYMEAPPGFQNDFKSEEVCRLKKSLYGLKQSPRAWFGRFTIAMKKYGYHQSNSDHTLFIKRRNGLVTCLIIYVDDMILTGDDKQEMIQLKKNLFAEFEMKDLGRLKYFLKVEVLRSIQGIFICQRKYVLDLLAETGMIDCKPAETPMMANQKLHMEIETELADKERYQRLVGKLIYLSHTRPDIAYAVGVVSQFMHQPQATHMEAVIRRIRYLKGTTGHGVLFKSNGHLEIQAYTDADWAGNIGDRRSTSGYFTLVGGNLVTWRSKKQKVFALSSAEAEFRGIARGLAEVLWIRKLLTEIGFSQRTASRIMCDNKAAIQISENPVQHDRTKHVEVDRHFIKEKLESGIIELPFVRSEDQLADILTKSVNGRIFNHCLNKLSVGDPTTQLEGEC